MNSITPEKIVDVPVSPQQKHEEIVSHAEEGVADVLKNNIDEYTHMKFFIDAVDSSDDDTLWKGAQYLSLTLNSMSQEFQKLLEKFGVNRKGITTYLKKILYSGKMSLYDNILKELAKIPDFKSLIEHKLALSKI